MGQQAALMMAGGGVGVDPSAAERMGLTPDWVIACGAFDVFRLEVRDVGRRGGGRGGWGQGAAGSGQRGASTGEAVVGPTLAAARSHGGPGEERLCWLAADYSLQKGRHAGIM